MVNERDLIFFGIRSNGERGTTCGKLYSAAYSKMHRKYFSMNALIERISLAKRRFLVMIASDLEEVMLIHCYRWVRKAFPDLKNEGTDEGDYDCYLQPQLLQQRRVLLLI